MRYGTVTFDSTIRSGLPVYVEARIYPPEPDVGIFYPQPEITSICWPRRPYREIPDHLVSQSDLERLQQEALEQ